MRVVVATAGEPFAHDDLRKLGDDLAAALLAAGHDVETIRIPLPPLGPSASERATADPDAADPDAADPDAVDPDAADPDAADPDAADPDAVERLLAVAGQWSLERTDAVIALAFPAYAIVHPQTTLWLADAPSLRSPALDAALAAAAVGAVRVLRARADLPSSIAGVTAELLEPPTTPAGWAAALEALGMGGAA